MFYELTKGKKVRHYHVVARSMGSSFEPFITYDRYTAINKFETIKQTVLDTSTTYEIRHNQGPSTAMFADGSRVRWYECDKCCAHITPMEQSIKEKTQADQLLYKVILDFQARDSGSNSLYSDAEEGSLYRAYANAQDMCLFLRQQIQEKDGL